MEAKLLTPFFEEIKSKIRKAQYAAMREVNIQLIGLYWEIGKSISEKQKLGWGKSVVKKLSDELLQEFPNSSGMSASNLWLMAQFYNSYYSFENLVPLVREIPWTHNVIILKRVKDVSSRLFYLEKCRSDRWTKTHLMREIENKTHLNLQHAQSSFSNHPSVESINLKDKYLFDFLQIDSNHSERELELGLINNVQKFLLEMGNQFSFIGSQFKIQLEGNEYFIGFLNWCL